MGLKIKNESFKLRDFDYGLILTLQGPLKGIEVLIENMEKSAGFKISTQKTNMTAQD